jgi:cytochrome P450
MGESVDLPVVRRHIFDPPAELGRLRAEGPVCPVRLPDGGPGWLVTGHAEVRRALTDPRLSARQDLCTPPPGAPAPAPATPGFFVRMDAPEHTRYRRLVAGHFTRRRLRQLAPSIARITETQLDVVARHGPPADLVVLFGMVVPALVIGEVLGVGEGDRDAFSAASRRAVDLTATPAEVAESLATIHALLDDLVAAKQAHPGDDVTSALLATGEVTRDEVAAMAFLLLVAGHETTANMVTLGVFALLCHPPQLTEFRRALAGDPDEHSEDSPAARAVDELLRYLTILQFGAMRVAAEDCDFLGQPVARGDTLILSLPAANRDPRAYSAPDRLQLDRDEAGHLAFGHGPHLCTGASLARLELRIMYARLLARFPALRLAVAPGEVPLRLHSSVYGVHSLPVAS